MKKIVFALTLALLATVLAVSAFAAPEISFDIEEEESLEGVYRIAMTITDELDFRSAEVTLGFDEDVIIPVDSLDGSIPDYDNIDEGAAYPFVFAYKKIGRKDVELTLQEGPYWTFDGKNSSVTIMAYWSEFDSNPFECADGFVMFDLFVKLAEGKTLEDLQHDSFAPIYIKSTLGNKFAIYGSEDESQNNVVLTNNVVPEATVITIPVTAGDIVYLQDGTKVNVAETNEAYELTADVGYVAVNTGITAQKTYYVDGTKATLVHENGVLASDKINLRDHTETFGGEDRSGLRFAEMGHNPLSRNVSGHEVTEVGVLMTTESNKVLTAIGSADNLTYDMVGDYVKSGYAYGKGYDRFVDSTVDDLYLFSAVMYNIPINTKNVQTNIVCRPYYKVGDTYIYGETKKATLYDIATKLQNSEDYEYLSAGQKAYVQEIIDCVFTGTDIEEGDIIIDIGGLYTPK